MNLKNYLKNEVLIASVILIVLSNLGGLINLAFQFIMARLLSSDDFGALAFLTNLIFLFGVPALAIQTAISKKTLILNSKSEYGKIKGLFFYSLKKVFLFSIGITALFISLAGIFYRQLGMRLDLLILASLLIFLSLIYPVVIGLM